jgi:triosephosphate isomerase
VGPLAAGKFQAGRSLNKKLRLCYNRPMKRLAKRLVVANWKMNPSSLKEAEKLLSSVVKNLPPLKKTKIIICAPFVYLEKLKKISAKISLGAQNASFEESGAFTGEVSSLMLANLGIKYVILGHSERRALGEDNALINKKVKETLAAGLSPILCVGETDRENTHGYFEVVKTQVRECLAGVNKNLYSKIIIAYEPVWALSTTLDRRDATAVDSAEMAIYIRKVISDMTTPKIAGDVNIIYGGSVNERDAGEFLASGVDGVLPGKASLTAEKFIKIVKTCEALKN